MAKSPIKLITYGDVKRLSYAKKESVLEMPDLLEMQKDSYNWFITEGLQEVLDDVSPIIDYNNNLILEFLGFELSEDYKYTQEECKERDTSFSAPLKLKVRLINKETQEIKEQDVFVGNIPMMTESGSFIINGAERVVVSQLVRSPGIYYEMDHDKTGKPLGKCTVIPNRGAWLEYETDSKDVFWVRVDRTRKVPVTCLIRAVGVSSDEQIIDLFGDDPKILASIEKDTSKTYEEAMIEIYKKLRPGEPPTLESAESLFNNMMFDDRRYDLSKVGRYKFNKKLSLANRANGKVLARPAVDEETGEILYDAGEKITKEIADAIQDAGINVIYVTENGKEYKIIGNSTVDMDKYTGKKLMADSKIKERVYLPVLLEIMEQATSDADLKKLIKKNVKKLVPKNITIDDILSTISYQLNLEYNVGKVDDIDHLGNRRIKCVGELLQNQFRIGLTRMEKVVRERMNLQNVDMITPQVLMNTRPVITAIKEFFGTSQLSQFMQQDNPLDELTHKRKLSALGPGGLSRERAGFEVRDIHYTHFGRMCPIETPEGPNIGLINSLAGYARVNEYGFVETPYRIIDKSGKKPVVTDECKYFTADEEELYNVAQANEPLDEKGHFVNELVTGRHIEDIVELPAEEFDLMEVSPLQMVSVATAMIPFLENDDCNRALMGSNMQRQSVPLLKPASAVVATGMEWKTATNSGAVVIAKRDGVVKKVEANQIIVETKKGEKDIYKLRKYKRSNSATCINQRPIVDNGDKVKAGQVLADGPSTRRGEMALGKNPLVAFMTWEGYNYEDAVLISERLVQDDVFTSIHIEEYEMQSRDT
ncbi:MAG: DNA-directed RNA polymerase subunit beta, partial [Clostridia bacterium]|nr:DNA-directed RNA polymerase subunit beta [Clostridia bacterium]